MNLSPEQNEYIKNIYISAWNRFRNDPLTSNVEELENWSIEVLSLSPESLGKNISKINSFHSRDFYSVNQKYSTNGEIGRAFILIPKRESHLIVSRIFGKKVLGDQLNEIESDVFLEIGNLLINCISESWFELLGNDIVTSIPHQQKGLIQDIVLDKNYHISINDQSILTHFKITTHDNKDINIFNFGTGDTSHLGEDIDHELESLV